VSYLFWGTVFDEGEDPASERVHAAGGPGWALAYHGNYEFGAPLEDLPGGREWQAVVERTDPRERHLAVHEKHGVGLNEADQAAWDAGGHRMLEDVTVSGTPDKVRDRLAGFADQGVTEIVFQPSGSDIRRELEMFISTAKTAVAV
jgi:alkanesulfonate monooxygenase SsuD/methylene tetrahydromethanopterin reductase-like flavin-dependent oxidoreductase (luciferase family)